MDVAALRSSAASVERKKGEGEEVAKEIYWKLTRGNRLVLITFARPMWAPIKMKTSSMSLGDGVSKEERFD